MTIAREGHPFILGSLIPGGLLIALSPVHTMTPLLIVGIVVFVFGLACAAFFRSPDRRIPSDEAVLVAPADGKVLQILDVDDDYVGSGTRIDIFLSVLDVHVNRAPAAGTIDFIRYRNGKFFSAFKDKASEDNERNDIGISGTWGKLRVAQIAGSIARRIVCHVRESERVAAGQLYGMIRFGSRTEITFPRNYEPTVKPGQHVKGGETIVGRLKDNA